VLGGSQRSVPAPLDAAAVKQEHHGHVRLREGSIDRGADVLGREGSAAALLDGEGDTPTPSTPPSPRRD
jgi:hypothetical protein